MGEIGQPAMGLSYERFSSCASFQFSFFSGRTVSSEKVQENQQQCVFLFAATSPSASLRGRPCDFTVLVQVICRPYSAFEAYIPDV